MIFTLPFLEAARLCITIIMAIMSFILLSVLYYRNGPRHHCAFFVFWGALSSTILLDKLLLFWDTYNNTPFLGLPLEYITIVLPLLASYALYRGYAFVWNDKILYIFYAAIPVIFFSQCLFLLFFSKDSSFIWNLLLIAPISFVACIAFICLGISIFLEPAAASVRWPVLIIFSIYAYLTIPAYIFEYINLPLSQEELSYTMKILRSWRVIGGIGLIFSLFTLLVSNNSDPSAHRFSVVCRYILNVLSVALSAYFLLFHVYKFLTYLKK